VDHQRNKGRDKKILQSNENGKKATFQTLWNKNKSVLKWKFVAISD
jgi:hypothetical protein